MTDPEGHLYGIVDAAQDERIYPLLQQCAYRVCLFVGKTEPEVSASAPWLISLDPSTDLFHVWRAEGWRANWGIWFHSSMPQADIETLFRRRTLAMLPDGDVVIFRFFDPRVFRNFLPTCTDDQLADWFSGIVAFLVPDLGGYGTIQYRLHQNALMISRH